MSDESSNADDGTDPPEDEARSAAEEIRALRAEIAALRERLDAVEQTVGIEGNRPADPSGAADPVPTADREEATVGESVEPEEVPADATDAGPSPRPAPDAAAEPSAGESLDADRDPAMAGEPTADRTPGWRPSVAAPAKWFGVVGVLALLVGVVLLVRFAIAAGYIGYGTRVLLAVGSGLGLIGLARAVDRRERYRPLARIVTGGGLAILYFGIFAAYAFESYRATIGTPLWATIAVLAVVVAGGVAIALYDDSRVIAAEAFLLGFVALVLAFEFALLALVFALLLAGAIASVAIVRGWIELALWGAGATYFVFIPWFVEHEEALLEGGLFLGAAFVIYFAVPLLVRRPIRGPWRLPDDLWRLHGPLLTVANAGAFAFFVVILLLEEPGWLRALPFVVLAGAFGAASAPRVEGIGRVAPYLSVLAGLIAITLAIPTIGVTPLWVVVLVGVFALAVHVGIDDLRYAAYLVTALVVVRLFVVDVPRFEAFTLADPLAPARLWPFLVAIVAFAGLAVWFRRRPAGLGEREATGRLTVPVVYAWLATLLGLVVLGAELDGVVVSSTWALFGLALLGGSIVWEWSPLRHQSIVVLALTVLKVFLVDTAGLDPLPRTISFLILGVILLVVAFVYMRYVREDGDDGGGGAGVEDGAGGQDRSTVGQGGEGAGDGNGGASDGDAGGSSVAQRRE